MKLLLDSARTVAFGKVLGPPLRKLTSTPDFSSSSIILALVVNYCLLNVCTVCITVLNQYPTKGIVTPLLPAKRKGVVDRLQPPKLPLLG